MEFDNILASHCTLEIIDVLDDELKTMRRRKSFFQVYQGVMHSIWPRFTNRFYVKGIYCQTCFGGCKLCRDQTFPRFLICPKGGNVALDGDSSTGEHRCLLCKLELGADKLSIDKFENRYF